MRKTPSLRMMLNSNELDFIYEAHNAINAKIVEEAGCRGRKKGEKYLRCSLL